MGLTVPLIPQDKNNDCWLACSAMLLSWKNQQTYAIPDALKIIDPAGTTFTPLYNADQPLPFASNTALVAALGLTALAPASYTIDYLTGILAASPIAAIIMHSATSTIAHWIVITGISGDQTPAGTLLTFNDPLPVGTGRADSTISFADFVGKFEAVVSYEDGFPGTDLTSQFFYFAS